MSLFRVIKYSSILFFLGKYKNKLFRVIAVLLFALVILTGIARPSLVVSALLAIVFCEFRLGSFTDRTCWRRCLAA